MSKHTSMKTRITVAAAVVAAFAGLVGAGPSASAATALEDCSASLNPQYRSWTVQCTAPHVVRIQTEHRWYWLNRPGTIYTTTGNISRLVEPGTPWTGRSYGIPEQVTIQLCMTAYQDSTLQITPRVCTPIRWP